MSVQIFLQAKILGIESFLQAAGDVEGRSHYISLLSEVLPRALLADLGLSKMLLGTSGGEQFLLVLPSEVRRPADGFLERAAQAVSRISGGSLHLLWAITENLGDWSDVRRRLSEQLESKSGAPAPGIDQAFFGPFESDENLPDGYFDSELGQKLREAESVGWSPETPGLVLAGSGKHQWKFNHGDGIPYARHAALSDDGSRASSVTELAARAENRAGWGLLRGDVDSFGIRLRRAATIEEHVQLSVMFKQFFAGELEVLCSMPEFWRKVTLLYSGGDDFAVYGSWDALIAYAREVHRVFSRFTEANLKDFVGPEGKTISMAVALAPDGETGIRSMLERAGEYLNIAKNSGKDCIYIFGRPIEWKQLNEAEETMKTMTAMVRDYGCSPQFLYEIAGFYREAGRSNASLRARGRTDRVDRPWRFHRRLNTVIGTTAKTRSKQKEFEKLRSDLISDFTGRRAAQVRLKPAGRVALEWARYQIEA